jgi:hypothetical protein
VQNCTNESINITTAYDVKNAEIKDDKNKIKQQEVSILEDNKLLRQQIVEQNKQIQKLSEAKEREESIKKQLPEDVVKIAEQVELSTSKLELLTDPKLRKHPAIQKSLVDTIKDFSLQKARITIVQKIRYRNWGAC